MADNLIQLILQADAANAVSAFQQAQSAANGLTSSTSGLTEATGLLGGVSLGAVAGIVAVGAAIAGAAAVMVTSASAAMDLGDATRRMTRETGIASQQASELLGVFDRYGVSSDQASRSLGIFEKGLRNYDDAGTKALTSTTGFAGAINELGIKTDDASGQIRPMTDLLTDISNKFAGLQDGPEKTALAMQLFGRSGKDMIDVLDQGGPAIQRMMENMNALGLSMSSEQVANVRAYELAHKDLSQAIQGVEVSIGNALMPAMTALMGLAVQAADAFNTYLLPKIRDLGDFIAANAAPAVASLQGAFSALAPVVMDAAGAILNAAQTLVGLAEQAYAWGANIVTQFANGMIQSMQPIFDAINSIGDAIAGLMQPGSPPKFLPNIDQWGTDTAQVWIDAWKLANTDGMTDGLAAAATTGLSAIDTAIKAQQEVIKREQLQATIASSKSTLDQKKLAMLELQKLDLQDLQPATAARKSGGGGGGGGGAAAGAAAALAKAQQDVALQSADGAGKVDIWQKALDKATPNTLEYAHAQLELAKAQDAVKKSQETTAKTAEQQAAALGKAKMDDALASADLAGKVKILDDAQKAAAPGSVEQIDLHRRETEAKNAVAKAAEADATKQKAASEAIEKAQLGANLAAADGAGKVALLTAARDKEKPGTVAYLDLQRQVVDQQNRNEAAQDSAAKSAASAAKATAGHAAALAKHTAGVATHAGVLANQLVGAQEKAALAGADHAGKIAILQAAYDNAKTPLEKAHALTALLNEEHKKVATAAGHHGKAVKDLQGPLEKLQDRLDPLAKTTGAVTTATDLATKAHDAYVKAAANVQTVIGRVHDAYAAVTGFIQGSVIPAFQAVAGALAPLVTSITSAVKNVADVFVNYGWQAALNVALSYVKVWGGQLVDWLVAEAPVIWNQLLVWGNQLWQWVAPMIPPLIAQAEILAQNLWTWIQAQATRLGTQLVVWGNQFWQWVKPSAMALLENATALKDQLVAWIVAQPPILAASLQTWANTFIAWVVPATKLFLEQWPTTLGLFLTWIGNAAGPILVKLGDWAVSFVAWILPNIPKILGALALTAAAIVVWLGETAAVLLNYTNNVWAPAFGIWVRKALPILGNALADMLNKMASWSDDAGLKVHAWLMDVGKQMVAGMQKGIEDAWGAFTSWAGNKLKGLVDSLKAAIKIGSPSRLLADEIGQWIPKGIAAGIDEHAHHIDDAMKRLIPRMTGSLPGMGSMPMSGSAVANYGSLPMGAGNVINYNLYLTSSATTFDAQQNFSLMQTWAGQ